MQDRVKYTDEFELEDDKLARKIRMDLKNSETRMKAIRTINRAYQRIINTMMQVKLNHANLVFGSSKNQNESDKCWIIVLCADFEGF